mgnify:CR=1 FL=1
MTDTDRLSSVGALTAEERLHLAERPDWSPIWTEVERLFAEAADTLKKMEARRCVD